MSTRDIRIAILTYLDCLPDGASIQPMNLAQKLQFSPGNVNPALITAQQRNEVEVLADGSVRLAPRLRGQFCDDDQKQRPSPTPVPLVSWSEGQPWEKLLTLLCSIGFLIVLLYVGLRTTEIPDRQFIILRTILALSGAGFAMGIPGFITAEVLFKNIKVRAFGAAAVFVIIYFILPAI